MEDFKNKQVIIDFLKEHTEEDYYKTKVEFTFAGKRWKTFINFAYFNGELDEILNKYNIPHDRSWMMDRAFTKKNYENFMDGLVKKLYDINYNDNPQRVILDVLTLTNEMTNYFSDGNKISMNFNLLSVMKEAKKSPDLYKLLFENKIDRKWTPEKIMEHRKSNIDMLKNKVYTPGVSELMQSGYGIKDDQTVNIYAGIDLIPRIHNMHEMFPRPVDTDWLWGIQDKDQFFMTANINAYALYMSKSIIQRAGVINKIAAMIAQDTTIAEHDCGTKTFVEYDIPDENTLKTLRFKYMVKDDGSLEEITLDHKHLIGTTVKVRSIYTCCAKNGQVCELCFGTNARWNKSTKEYRKDIGVEFTKIEITPVSQDIISTKHNTAPKLIALAIHYILENSTKEHKIKNLEENEFFVREFNIFRWKPGVRVFLKKEDCENPVYQSRKEKKELARKKITLTEEELAKKPLEYMDNEFGEVDIIRSSALIIEMPDGRKLRMYPNSHFRIKGFNVKEFMSIPSDTIMELDPIINEVSHVIRNDAKALRFYDIENLYKLATPENDRQAKAMDNDESWNDTEVKGHLVKDWLEFIRRVNEVFPNSPKVRLETIFRNKIRDANDPHKRPDWKSDNPDPIVLTHGKTIAARPSLSLKISAGRIIQRLNDPFYHDVSNLMNTSYDRMYADVERDKDEE